MTDKYGPDDPAVPEWAAPGAKPEDFRSAWANAPAGQSSAPPAGSPIPQATGVPTYRSWQPGFMPLRPLGLGDFISLPMKAIAANRAAIIGGPLLCMLAIFLPVAAAMWFFIQETFNPFRQTFVFNNPSGTLVVTTIVAILVLMIADAAARAFVIPAVSRGILGQRLTLGQAWAITRTRLAAVISLYLIALVVVVAGYTLLFAVLSVSRAAYVIAGIAWFVLVCYGVVVFGIALSIVVLERSPALEAISRARRLIKGHAWRLFWNIVLIGLIVGVISNVIANAAQLPVLFLDGAGTSTAAAMGAFSAVVLFLLLVQAIMTYSYMGTVYTLMYVDVRIRKEGFDLDLARAAEEAGR